MGIFPWQSYFSRNITYYTTYVHQLVRFDEQSTKYKNYFLKAIF